MLCCVNCRPLIHVAIYELWYAISIVIIIWNLILIDQGNKKSRCFFVQKWCPCLESNVPKIALLWGWTTYPHSTLHVFKKSLPTTGTNSRTLHQEIFIFSILTAFLANSRWWGEGKFCGIPNWIGIFLRTFLIATFCNRTAHMDLLLLTSIPNALFWKSRVMHPPRNVTF